MDAVGSDVGATATRVHGEPAHLIVMGVSGSGKTTVARALAARLSWPYAEGDDFHPRANRDAMAAGHPLSDADRLPWLRSLATWAGARHAAGESTIMSCSALRRGYRDVLRGGAPGTAFVHLRADRNELLARMQSREHFFPPGLLDSQLLSLQPLEDDEDGITLHAVRSACDVIGDVVEWVEPT